MSSNRTVYVGNVSSRVREKELKIKFEKYGKIRRFELLRDFAFVDFEDSEDAKDAIEGMDGYEMEGKQLQVELARSKGRGADSGGGYGGGGGGGGGTNRIGPDIGSGIRGGAVRGKRDNCVIVKNLSSRTGWQDLKDWARQCGAVEYADIWTDKGKKFGVIKFINKKDYKYALEKLDDQYLDGRNVRVLEDSGDYMTSRSGSRSSSGSRDRRRSRSYSRSRSRSRSRSHKKKNKKKSKDKDDSEKKENNKEEDDFGKFG